MGTHQAALLMEAEGNGLATALWACRIHADTGEDAVRTKLETEKAVSSIVAVAASRDYLITLRKLV